MKKYFIFLLLLLMIFSTNSAFAETPKADIELGSKYELLISKGLKKEKSGDYEEALEAYQEAYEITKNIQPLLNIAILHAKIGNYRVAERRLKEIPSKKLPPAGQAEVAFTLGKIYIAKGDIVNASREFSDALKLFPGKSSARIRSAMTKLISGMAYSAEELIANEEFSFDNGYTYEDLKMCFAIDMYIGKFGRAYNTCELISKMNIEKNPKSNFWDLLTNQPFFLFFSFLPLFLSRFLAIFYYIILLIALGSIASVLAKSTKLLHIGIFIVIGVILLSVAQNLCINSVYLSLLNGYCYIYDTIWILPKLIIAVHLISLSLFLIFPCFKFVRENMRPACYELLGIWLFCFFFGLFVLSFQSNFKLMPKLIYSVICLALCAISALIMPFGKLLLYKLSQATGLSIFGKVTNPELSNGNLSFTDTKILENKMWNFLNNGDIPSALALGKKVLNKSNQNSFPSFWQAMIVAQISNEYYEMAAKNINEYYLTFQGTNKYESGQVYEAWLKTEKGDFPTAYKLVNSISDDRAKSMTADEAGISLLVLARCCMNMKDNVQAHINLNKALSCVKSQLFKSIILAEIAELDTFMDAKQSMQKWKSQISNISGKGKCISYLNIVKSMVAYSEGKAEEAFKLASECKKDKIPNGKAIFWLGHLLCLDGKSNDAEELLSRMTAGSYNAERLMTEVTSTTVG